MKKITVISINTFYAKQIFNNTKIYEFRKSPLKKELLNEKIYVYSAKGDKAIIGYFRVNKILSGDVNQILTLTGYDKRKDKNDIINYFGKNRKRCFALQLYDITLYKRYLTLNEMKKRAYNVVMPQYFKYIYEDDPLYDVITKWDKDFS